MHTIAHIHEMKAEIKDGLEFMQRSETHWKVRSCPRVICLENSVYPLELSRGFMEFQSAAYLWENSCSA